MTLTLGRVLLCVSVLIFILVAFGVNALGMNELEEVAAGLGFFAAGHLLP